MLRAEVLQEWNGLKQFMLTTKQAKNELVTKLLTYQACFIITEQTVEGHPPTQMIFSELGMPTKLVFWTNEGEENYFHTNFPTEAVENLVYTSKKKKYTSEAALLWGPILESKR